jgi:hypothetical protein
MSQKRPFSLQRQIKNLLRLNSNLKNKLSAKDKIVRGITLELQRINNIFINISGQLQDIKNHLDAKSDLDKKINKIEENMSKEDE